jgi:hypothetical protein
VALDAASQQGDLVTLMSEFLSEGGPYKTCSSGDKDFHGQILLIIDALMIFVLNPLP